MLTYSQLDRIADSYIPALFLISIYVLAVGVFKLGLKRKGIEIASVVFSIVIVYGVMLLDNTFKIWSIFDLDYSTHTALSLVFVVYLSSKNKTLLRVSIISFLLYVLLMLYQKYHSVADILSTAIILIPLFWLLLHREKLTCTTHKSLKRAP